MSIIEASRDLAALERLIPLYIEQAATQAEGSLAARKRALRIATAVNPERFETVPGSLSSVTYCFQLWIGHLGWLDQISAGVQFALGDLRPEEAHGLALLRRARDKFWQEHSSCPACDSVNLRIASFCGGCGKEFQ